MKNVQQKTEALKNLLDPRRVERARKEERKRSLTKGLTIGAVLGGLAGIFFAPDTGENTRRKTKEEISKMKENLQTEFEEGKEKFEVNFAEGKEKFTAVYEDQKDVLTEKISTLKEKMKYQDELNVVEDDELETEELAKEEA
ncbi:MAG: YtxH domain-containing protein [Clostridiaceae bacterium]|nr:YtxH domain-containing protein [Clostridiaceae bacterium]